MPMNNNNSRLLPGRRKKKKKKEKEKGKKEIINSEEKRDIEESSIIGFRAKDTKATLSYSVADISCQPLYTACIVVASGFLSLGCLDPLPFFISSVWSQRARKRVV